MAYAQRLDCDSLPFLLQQEGVLGVARFDIRPTFSGRTICTLLYLPSNVRISIVDAREQGQAPFQGAVTRPLDSCRRFGPLASWKTLRAAAFAAPSCASYDVCDGVSFIHAALDWDGGIEATWCNPGLWPEHRPQCEIVDAYHALLEAGLLLEPGTRVRLRAGPLSGCVGKVERVDRHKNRARVIAELVGGSVTVDLAATDVELAE